MMDRIKFIVIEHSYLLRKGIVSVINRIEHASVIKELDNIDKFNSELINNNPDFVVINLSLVKEYEQYRNNILDDNLLHKTVIISSDQNSSEIPHSNFKHVIYINDSKEIIYSKLNGLVTNEVSTLKSEGQLTELSEREKTILKYVAKGFTNKEIAEKLFLSAHTVITHRKNITAKLGIKSISGLTVYAILNEIVKLEEIQ